MAASLVIQADGLSKKYKFYPTPFHRIREGLSFGWREYHRPHWALRDVSLRVPSGICLGVVGANGAGKSTLLKILSGTTVPTAGTFHVRGRVSSLLELGAGFHEDFTGIDNIYMNGSLMGLSRAEIERRIPAILEFSEMKRVIDQPVKHYSTGMHARLGFSIAIAWDPDVLLVDEVLAVGDFQFQKRCIDKINRLKASGKTILFTSHSLYHIRTFADEAIWLKQGGVERSGDPVAVTNEYCRYQVDTVERDLFFLEGEGSIARRGPEDSRTAAVDLPRIVRARLVRTVSGEETYRVRTGEDLAVEIWIRRPDPSEPMHVGVAVERSDRTLVYARTTRMDGATFPAGATWARIELPRFPLLQGEYTLSCILLDPAGVHFLHEMPLPDNLVVENEGREVGVFNATHRWSFGREVPLPGDARGSPEATASPDGSAPGAPVS